MQTAGQSSALEFSSASDKTQSDVCWDELREIIEHSPPVAAEKLHSLYADGLRILLSRNSAVSDPQGTIRSILLRATQFVSSGEVDCFAALTRKVHTIAAQQIRESRQSQKPANRRSMAASATLPRQLRDVFAKLSALEREVLLRVYILEQGDDDISQATSVSASAIEAIRSKARTAYGRLRNH